MDALVVPVGVFSTLLTNGGLERHVPPDTVQLFDPSPPVVDLFTTMQMVTYRSGWWERGNGQLLEQLRVQGLLLVLTGDPEEDLAALSGLRLYTRTPVSYRGPVDDSGLWVSVDVAGESVQMSFFTMWCLADEDGRDVPASLHAAVATLEPVGPEVTERPWVSPEVLELLYGDVLPLVNGGFVCVGRA